ncbi:MAG: Ig-like domain-containing protein [Candidatus Limnocylindrales bacterium]
MRDAIAVVLGLPAAVASRLARSGARRPALRMAALAAVVALMTVAALNTTTSPITAFKTTPVDPHAAARMAASVEADFDVGEPVVIDFSTPMDPASVAAATAIQPAAATKATWSNGGRTLHLAPRGAWQPGTFYTITIDASAADATGKALTTPVRVIFFTRQRPAAQLAVTRASGRVALPETGIAIRFSAPVQTAAVAKAFSVEPTVEGSLLASAEPGDSGADRFIWTPTAPLEPGRTYVFRLAASVADGDGVAITSPLRLEVQVAARPTVVRSRPGGGATKIDRDQTISVRFSMPMDKRVTRGALRVSGLDPLKDAKISWLESGRVMVVDPDRDFAYGDKVTVAITGAARSAAGVPLGDDPAEVAYKATFTVEPKPAARRQVTRASSTKPKPSPSPSPSPSTGSAPWLSVEKYYLKLLNCTRTGGWVQADGSCKGYGSGTYSAYRKPLSLSSGISSKVARPYAKKLAIGNDCSHFIGGDPGDRLRRAGYTNWTWAENIGCRSGNAYDAVLASHRFFQSEKDSNGGHWRNIKDPDFSTVGIGVWKADGRVRLVTDFYHP